MVKRLISLDKGTSSIWFGPRQSGKSTLIRQELYDSENASIVWEVDLLESDLYRKYLKSPEQFRKDAEYQIVKNKKQLIFVDEIQKVPALTDEIHRLIEKFKVVCILSGSSARKLKMNHANLLGGRAIVERLFPLTAKELGEEFELEVVLQHGSLAGIYFDTAEHRVQKLRAYVETYLKEEIAQEGLVRNYDVFNRFLDLAAAYPTELLSYTNIAKSANTNGKTIQNYYSILYETLIAFELPSWDRSVRKQLARHPKFYFCDNGINNAICSLLRDPLPLTYRGKMFEQWVINEVRAYLSYQHSELKCFFWRTERGEFEVDLLLARGHEPKIAIEIKAKNQISEQDLKGLRALAEEYPNCRLICICETRNPFELDGVEVVSYSDIPLILI